MTRQACWNRSPTLDYQVRYLHPRSWTLPDCLVRLKKRLRPGHRRNCFPAPHYLQAGRSQVHRYPHYWQMDLQLQKTPPCRPLRRLVSLVRSIAVSARLCRLCPKGRRVLSRTSRLDSTIRRRARHSLPWAAKPLPLSRLPSRRFRHLHPQETPPSKGRLLRLPLLLPAGQYSASTGFHRCWARLVLAPLRSLCLLQLFVLQLFLLQ